MEPRNEPLEQYLDVLAVAVRHYARDAGLDYNDVEDCVAELHRRRLCTCSTGPLRADTDEERKRAWRLARWFLKRWIYNRAIQRKNAPIVSLDQMRENCTSGILQETASHNPGPEEAVISKADAVKITRALSKLQILLKECIDSH